MDAITAEFLPAAQEIEATPPRPLGRAVLWALIALCIAATAWASLSRVDIVATAPGKLVPAASMARAEATITAALAPVPEPRRAGVCMTDFISVPPLR